MNNEKIRICYLVQAYSDYQAFKYLIERLLNEDASMIFVHLDSKSDLDKFFVENEKVIFIENREFVSWAGFHQGKLILNLIEAAVNYQEQFDLYCFISESDFPVYESSRFLESIINCKNIMLNCSKHQPRKIEKYWFFDFNIKSVNVNKILNKIINGLSELLYNLKILRKPSKLVINDELVDVYFSSPFWKYNYNQIKYINNTYKSNPSIEKYFRYSFASCELIVPTIIANSMYRDELIFVDKYINLNHLSGMCYFKYTGPRVDVLTLEDYDEIIKSNKPFIRKVNRFKSKELLEKLKEL